MHIMKWKYFLGGMTKVAFIIEKFGGTSLADGERIARAAAIAAAGYLEGHRIVAVVSAMGDTTDRLISMAREMGGEGRELDALMATGEQTSAALMAMCLSGMGIPAVSLCGWQAGINTDGIYGGAAVKYIETSRIMSELEHGRLPVIAGFQGLGPGRDITTLGRGGSDTTAVELAGALGADICRIYTDVPGVCTADPSVVPEARVIKHLCYDDMLELSRAGAGVLHPGAAEAARRLGVPVRVLASREPEGGTMIDGNTDHRPDIAGAAIGGGTVIISVGSGGDMETRHRLFKRLAGHGVNVEAISWGSRLCFAVPSEMKEAAERETERTYPGAWEAREARRLSLVGKAASAIDPARMIECIGGSGIEPLGVFRSHGSISALMPEEGAEEGLRALHRRFIEK